MPPTINQIKILIVDDEPLARQRIRMLLKGLEHVEIVGECPDGLSAVDSILDLKPDLVFLDVQMPEFDGFDVVHTIGPNRMPVVIFVTAYDQYAVKAFDVHAVDYLLKPFERSRFQIALQKAVREIGIRQKRIHGKNMRALMSSLMIENRFRDRIIIKSAGQTSVIKTGQIDWIESAGNYVKINTGNESHLLRHTMKQMEIRLNDKLFIRTHRSVIVNLERVREYKPGQYGDYIIILRNGARLPLSRRYKNEFLKLFRDI